MIQITDKCTGCRACEKICPKHCIVMEPDKEGFLNAQIIQDLCIDCGACKKTCPQNVKIVNETPLKVYALRAKNNILLKRSASGGVFAVAANYIIKKQGVVFGAAYDTNMQVTHIKIDNFQDLWKLQSSKYVQSDTKDTYIEVKQLLNKGIFVLYSGTPCQIAGLNRVLKKNYKNLITMDIICHGVPSPKIFAKYIEWQSEKLRDKVNYCNFRDKSDGWGQSLMLTTIHGKKKSIIGPSDPFYYNFLKGNLHRPCCYECHYASQYRPADITMGDYWGIEREHKKFFSYKGVSLLMLNNRHSIDFFNKIKDEFNIVESTYEKAARKNSNLRAPSIRGNKRNILYNQIDTLSPKDYFEKELYVPKTLKNIIKAFIPSKIRLFIKMIKTYAYSS